MSKVSLLDIIAHGETVDIECKAAQGRDGNGELPGSFWETYSAMANTSGGEIYLGISEPEKGKFHATGINNPEKVIKTLWDTLHGRNKVNRNILADSHVKIILVEGKTVIRVHVPLARRQDRPVHLGANPFGNTYVRRYESDYKADDETVKRMIAESVEDSRDDRVLDNFSIGDLDKDTIAAYRNLFSAVKPESPWLELSTDDFLLKTGACGRDRATGKTGLRAAGLLMFGRFEAIREVFPHYMVDYQERPEARAEERWIDRLVPDGTWSGNLYDFFQKTYRKLISEIKIPFKLRDGVRSDDSPVHEALREALTNTLIHADYTGRVSVLVVKRPDMFGFRNPGLMRIAVEQAVQGGISDCRNRRIQDMFRYIGLGDHAGSGLPKIYRNWKAQHWRLPLLREDRVHEQTLLELRMISMVPEESVKQLDGLFGDKFRGLPELERIVLITAATEDAVNHDRIKEISTKHPRDISDALSYLVHEGMLVKQGETRGSYYRLQPKSGNTQALGNSLHLPENSSRFPENSSHLPANSPDLPANSPDLPANSPDLRAKLARILADNGFSKMPGKAKADIMRKIICQLSDGTMLTLKEFGVLLHRDPKSLQDQYLTPMVAEGLLEMKYPHSKNHPDQAYRKKP